tara:strand:+ start:314 stop:724 length:411 start_codon:yes stop_codon:yes gene_type:complete
MPIKFNQVILDKLKKGRQKTLSKKVELSLLSDLDGFTRVVNDARVKLDDAANDFVIRYMDIQNEGSVLSDLQFDYIAYMSDLKRAMERLEANVSELGIDPMSIQEYEDAALTEGIFRANLDDFAEIVSTAQNMEKL